MYILCIHKKEGAIMRTEKEEYKLSSIPEKVLNDRYLVKTSIFELAGHDMSISVVILDLLRDNQTTLKYFSKEKDAVKFIKDFVVKNP